ncbi:uncharacterized protein RHOBADRAFT_53675 [Rhodotorula graminis WP1]|uniref:Uncharacterized protein n=1 Tax=Rhodotorula graminis (strain WP1) TaxID=578459 RepID=A0A194S2H7_RHOGW|nr:uncharacterized protein RHOBADRAFT_53675 [Rhodotorula graminis WP1]KPV74724.1 hypothetical protein RHOBADRAFT_53675 [Rhodotorula graminis WP1]
MSHGTDSHADPANAHEPVASTSTLPPPARRLATLGNLPPELKLLIVQAVARLDLEDDGDKPILPPAHWVDDVYGPDDDDSPYQFGAKRRSSSQWPAGRIRPDRPKDDFGEGEGDDDGSWADVDELELDDEGNPSPEALAKVREQYAVDMADALAPTGIDALTLVNREFSAIAIPIKWVALDLSERSNEAIAMAVCTILPHRGLHVRSIQFAQAPFKMYDNDDQPDNADYPAVPDVPLSDQFREVIEAIEHVCGHSGVGVSNERRVRRVRSILLATVVRLCSNTVRVHGETFPRTRLQWLDDAEIEDEADIDDHMAVYAHDHAFESVKKYLGPQLVDLTLVVPDDGVTNELDVADIIAACPKLLRLELDVGLPEGDRAHRLQLHDALAALPALEVFAHSAGVFINDEFAARDDVKWPLKLLGLAECENLSFPSLRKFVHRFKATLECLDLDGAPHTNVDRDNDALCALAFDLPKLDTLILSTQQEAPFLVSAFASCPIEALTLGFCPAVDLHDLETFIDVHALTLRRIEVAGDAALSEAQVESLEVLCHAKGIECELLPPDDDDSDLDDDPSEWGGIVADGDDDTDQDEWTEEDDDAGDWSDEEEDE